MITRLASFMKDLGMAFRPAAFALALLCGLLPLISLCPAHAQTLTVLHNFSGRGDGGNPSSGLAIDAAGNLYGTTIFGGSDGYGLVFNLRRNGSNWTEVPLYSFTGGDDGSQPYTTPLLAADGTVYGANYGQLHECCGAAFHLRPSPTVPRSVLAPWNLDLMHHFTGGADGAYPNGDLAMDPIWEHLWHDSIRWPREPGHDLSVDAFGWSLERDDPLRGARRQRRRLSSG